MATPRVFISSTFYDLKHVRASLDAFIESLGYDPVLSEKGSVAYSPDIPLDESCYAEVSNADVVVLILGGRYGSPASEESEVDPSEFWERYRSITRGEYRVAVEQEIPTYILVERGVYAEYQTFKRNRENLTVNYAHVDSVNVFLLIDEILSRPRNNPVHQFEKAADIEGWLRLQWAGLFREFLRRNKERAQLATLQSEVERLVEVNETLKTYLEAVVSKVPAKQAAKLVEQERERLKHLESRRAALENTAMQALVIKTGREHSVDVLNELEKAESARGFLLAISEYLGSRAHGARRLFRNKRFMEDLNEVRIAAGLPAFTDILEEEPAETSSSSKEESEESDQG